MLTAVDERLAVRMSKARVRLVEDFTLALQESQPSKTSVEAALREQIEHGKKLVEIASLVCKEASPTVGPNAIHKELEWALTVAARAFRDLEGIVQAWSRQHGANLDAAKDLGTLVAALDDRRAELFATRPAAFPGLEPDKVAQAIRDLDAGRGQPLDQVLSRFSN